MMGELLKTPEVADLMGMSKSVALGILKQFHLSPIDLGPGRGRGLRWHRGAVKAVIDTLHAEAQPKQKVRVAIPKEVRPVLGKSPRALFDELYNRGAAQ